MDADAILGKAFVGTKNVEITPVINFVVGSLNERPTLSSPSIRLIPPKMIVSVEECRSNALNQKKVNSVYFANFSCPISDIHEVACDTD